nr:hypothetical protein [Tanacetum cinerariifolium]
MGYEHLSITPETESDEVTESNAKNLLPIPSECKNLVPIPRECKVTLDNRSESIEPVKDDSSVFTTISNPLLDNDEINYDELESHVESNSVESTSNHDTVKFDNLDAFSRPLIPIHIVEEERIRREHSEYINRMEMLFTINPRPHPTIDIVTDTDDVLPPGVENDDSDGEVDAVDALRVDNSISNFEHEFSESEDSDFDNPSVQLPPLEPPDEEFDFKIDFGDEISVVRNTVVEFIDARVKFDVSNDENDDYSYFMFVKVFFLSAASEDMIFDPGPQDTNCNAGTQDNVDTGKEVCDQNYIVLPLLSLITSTFKSLDDKATDDKPTDDTRSNTIEELVNKEDQAYKDELDRLMSQEKEANDAADALRQEFEQGCIDQRGVTNSGSTNSFNTISHLINVDSTSGTFSVVGRSSPHPDAFIPANTLLNVDQNDSQIPDLEDTAKLQKANFNNMECSTIFSPIPTHRVHLDHPKDQILGDLKLAIQTKGMAKKSSGAHALAIGTKWVYKNKKDERGIVVRNKSSFDAYKIPDEFNGGAYILLRTAASTPIETQKPLVKDEEAADVDVYLYKSMIGSLMYLIASKPDIMFAVCACFRFQVTQKLTHLYVVKMIFRNLKGQPKLGLWYPRDSLFELEAYSDSDYAGANLDRKSTTGGSRLISWQCKKQTIVATSITEAEYVAAANCCGQVLWI